MLDKQIGGVREFNRFYTNVIGLLDNHVYDSEFTLPEARVLYELHHHKICTASDIIAVIDVDKGYLSRLLHSFEKRNIIKRSRSNKDGRSAFISLTEKGKQQFFKLNKASINQATDLLEPLSEKQREELLSHMNQVRKIIQLAIEKSNHEIDQ
jgi:DNA-binding MarR family transcriptional regulator